MRKFLVENLGLEQVEYSPNINGYYNELTKDLFFIIERDGEFHLHSYGILHSPCKVESVDDLRNKVNEIILKRINQFEKAIENNKDRIKQLESIYGN